MMKFEPSDDFKRVNDLLYGGYLGISLLIFQAFIGLPIGAIIGIIAVFWHLSWISGLFFSISGGIGYLVCMRYYSQVLEMKKGEANSSISPSTTAPPPAQNR